MYTTILFDLDGTLTDPGEGITNSVAYALKKYGIEVEDRRELNRFIGPPLIESFIEFYGFDMTQAKKAVGYYREYFCDRGMFENSVYDGVPEMLRTVKDSDKRLIVATSKPWPFAERILKHFSLDPYFEFVAGSELDETRTAKADVIKYALESQKITDMPKVLMVGDRKHDVIGAAECGIDCAGVLYGYGSREELDEAGAKYIVGSPAELCDLICK